MALTKDEFQDRKDKRTKKTLSIVISQDSSLKDLLNRKLLELEFKTEFYECGETALEAIDNRWPSLLIVDPPFQNSKVKNFLNDLKLITPRTCRILFLSSPLVEIPKKTTKETLFVIKEGCQDQLEKIRTHKNASILFKPFSMKLFEKEAKECLLSVR
jgi:response regulator RpfG family c-di-GMP phosphodiesterase